MSGMRGSRGWSWIAGGVSWISTCVSPSNAAANNGTGVDAQENVFGATNINAVTGFGRLTEGVSKDGDVTVLSWPNPSYNDQLGYLSSNDLDARDQPRFGAPEGAGIFLGLDCTFHDGSNEVLWLRDRNTWDIGQDYGPTDGPNPHTSFFSSRLGLRVVLVDAVAPAIDTLVRDVEVRRLPTSPVTSCALLSYANLSLLPPNARVAELPMVDWLFDGRNDFAAIWDEQEQAVVQFHPNDQRVHRTLTDLVLGPGTDWGIVGEHLRRSSLDDLELSSLAREVGNYYSEGSWALITTEPPPSQHQVGFDATPFCEQIKRLSANIGHLTDRFEDFQLPIPSWALKLFECWRTGPELVAHEGWRYPAQDPWTDVQDGELAGHGLAAGEVAAALRTELRFADDVAQAALIVGFGRNRTDALQAASVGRDAKTVVASAEQALATWLSSLRIPGAVESGPWKVARRALINLHVGTSVDTGAVVASIARQPPYALDWPRDGAFFNLVFDASGQTELASARANLYATWQRRGSVAPTTFVDPDPPVDPDSGQAKQYPADAWEMNYYADGLVGGTFRFEIDTTAFAVWSLVARAGWAKDPAGYLQDQWPSIESGAQLLRRWRDPNTGLQAPAQEDDAAEHTQTLHGAITVFGALDIAARAARMLGYDALASAWDARAGELRASMERHFYDDDAQAFLMDGSGRLPMLASGLTATGPGAWVVWPMTLYDFADSRVQGQLAHDKGVIEPALNLESVGGLYFMKNTIPLALAGREAFPDFVAGLPTVLSSQATPDTKHFGEVMVVATEGNTRSAEQRVSTPHLWEGALYYLTALAVEDPDALLPYEHVLPPSSFHAPPKPQQPPPDAGTQDDGSVPVGVEPGEDGGSDAGREGGSSRDPAPGESASGHEANSDGCGCGIARQQVPRTMLWLAGLLLAGLRRPRNAVRSRPAFGLHVCAVSSPTAGSIQFRFRRHRKGNSDAVNGRGQVIFRSREPDTRLRCLRMAACGSLRGLG